MTTTTKIKSIFLLIIISAAFPVLAIELDGITYNEANRAKEGSAMLIEYLPPEQDLQNWTTMVSIQCHLNSNFLSEVVEPYFEARQSLIAAEPEIFETDSNYAEDVVILLFLGSPELGRVEFSASRFFRKDLGVIGVIFSYNLPVEDSVDVAEIMNNRENWINGITNFSYNDLNSECESE